MPKMYFAKTVRYKGATHLPNTEFEVDKEDLDTLKTSGGWVVESQEDIDAKLREEEEARIKEEEAEAKAKAEAEAEAKAKAEAEAKKEALEEVPAEEEKKPAKKKKTNAKDKS